MRRASFLVLALVLWAVPAVAQQSDHLAPTGVASPARDVPDSARFDQEIADGNLINMTQTNYGFFGNNFFLRKSSLEYPANSGFEHMVRGGVWIGALGSDANGEFYGVTAGTVDAAQGPNSTAASEFTPSGLGIKKRSTLPTNQFYDPLRAISELDFISDYNDFTPVQVANSEPHRPLSIEVHQETYQWSFAEFQNILFVHLEITNRGSLLKDLWVGIYSELMGVCKKCYFNWPGSASDGSGEGTPFYKKYVVVDDSLKLEREHYCYGPIPPESNCRFEHVPYWMGIRQLGTKGLAEDTTSKKLSFSIHKWTVGNPFWDEDIERYPLMASGLIMPTDGDTVKPQTGDPVEILSVGPFPLVYKDSTISVDFAFVGGRDGAAGDPRDIQLNSKFAQFAYDHHYVLPIPPPSPNFAVVARDTALDFYWDDLSESAYDVTSPNPHDFEGYRLYIGDYADSLTLLAQFDAVGDTASFNTGFGAVLTDPVAMVGRNGPFTAKYKYTVHGLRDGFKYFCAVTAFDQGNSQIQPLESGFSQNRLLAVPAPMPGERAGSGPTVFPNPYRVEARWDQGANVRDHYLWFANLPERCTLRIFTLAGDLVFEKKFDGGTYHGEGSRGIYDPSQSLGQPTLSGTSFGWDLITTQGQAIATGLYLYSVEDLARSGKYHVGKFLVVKSDREGQ